MNIIIPMAGRGSRLRPHTLTTPKPLIPVGGKPIVHRLVEDIAKVLKGKIDKIGFIIGEDFGEDVERELLQISERLGAKGSIHYQVEKLGTAHAILCAEELLEGPTVVAYADTLFRADFTISPEDDGILWVKRINDPSAFGVVQMNEKGEIVDFIEKPKEWVSDLAMIGVYYFKKGEDLKAELNYLIEHNIIKGGEYQLPDALRRLTENGTKFKPGEVSEWLDCGNKSVTVDTNQRVLEFDKGNNLELIDSSATLLNSVVIPPCYIGKDVVLKNSVIGPHVSVGAGSSITGSVVKNTIIQDKVTLENVNLKDSMIGSHAVVIQEPADLSISDYSTIDL